MATLDLEAALLPNLKFRSNGEPISKMTDKLAVN